MKIQSERKSFRGLYCHLVFLVFCHLAGSPQYFSHRSLCGVVDSGFVPAFEKIGKTCHLYLTRNELILLHNVLSTDGVQAIASLSRVGHASISK